MFLLNINLLISLLAPRCPSLANHRADSSDHSHPPLHLGRRRWALDTEPWRRAGQRLWHSWQICLLWQRLLRSVRAARPSDSNRRWCTGSPCVWNVRPLLLTRRRKTCFICWAELLLTECNCTDFSWKKKKTQTLNDLYFFYSTYAFASSSVSQRQSSFLQKRKVDWC